MLKFIAALILSLAPMISNAQWIEIGPISSKTGDDLHLKGIAYYNNESLSLTKESLEGDDFILNDWMRIKLTTNAKLAAGGEVIALKGSYIEMLSQYDCNLAKKRHVSINVVSSSGRVLSTHYPSEYQTRWVPIISKGNLMINRPEHILHDICPKLRIAYNKPFN